VTWELNKISFAEFRTTTILTFLADVIGLQVGEEVFLARLEQVHCIIRDGDGTMASTGAPPVQMLQHIGPAADLVLGRETLTAGGDAAIARLCYDHHEVRAAAGVERVGKTVLAQFCIQVSRNDKQSGT